MSSQQMRAPIGVPEVEVLPGEVRRWSVEETGDGSAAVDVEKARAQLPASVPCSVCRGDHVRNVILHEMAHVRWSTGSPGEIAKNGGVSLRSVQAAEDFRVNAAIGLGQVMCDEFLGSLVFVSVAEAARVIVAGGPDWIVEWQDGATFGEIDGWAQATRVLAWARARQMAVAAGRAWQDVTEAEVVPFLPWAESKASGLRTACQQVSGCPVRDSMTVLPLARYLDSLETTFAVPRRAPNGRPGRSTSRTDVPEEEVAASLAAFLDAPWGHLIEERLPMPHLVGGSLRGRRAGAEGGILVRDVAEAVLCGVLRQNRRDAGEPLTVLVDCSGSMAWEVSDLLALLALVPRATVALYSGGECECQGVDHGEVGCGRLVIVADRGRRARVDDVVSALHDFPGGNVIDGPALEWLAARPGVRLNVGDGRVGTMADSNVGISELREFERVYGIIRLPDGRAVSRWLEAEGRRFRPRGL